MSKIKKYYCLKYFYNYISYKDNNFNNNIIIKLNKLFKDFDKTLRDDMESITTKKRMKLLAS